MREFKWLNHLTPNRLFWAITWDEHEGIWYVKGGEDLLLKTDSREVAEAFLYGLGLAYSVLPDDIFSELERNVRHLLGEDEAPTSDSIKW